MIIATALKKVFTGFTLDIDGVNRDVQFHYGDQKELLLWVKNRGNYPKYPLIWYVLNRYTEHNGRFKTDARIVLMALTRATEMNTWRAENTYLNILQPLFDKVENTLLTHPYITIYGNLPTKFEQKDEPKYGIPRNNDETIGSSSSISQDFVDAKIITFNLEIQPYCII